MEQWKEIKGFEGKYIVSNTGKVMSLPRIIGHGRGYMKPGRILDPIIDKDGYEYIGFPIENRRVKKIRIHRLVTTHFISDFLPNGFQICHKDGNKRNNNADNLYIGDNITNTIDKYRHGQTKLTVDQVKEIRLLGGKMLQREIADKFNISGCFVSEILSGKKCSIVK